ncbi:Abi family protein [Gemella cuniculi]|uniref:Abi family protein n=1 Tax=Gemella cuniculi TaxID=150240 RepID=UPI00040D767C|nr:Abi family protein [Gemella cuniculi]
MNKNFMTIEEQIDLLKSRNLKFKNEEKAKLLLIKNNYYNLINNYSKFLYTSDNIYFDDVYFEDIVIIHYFDKELKILLFSYLIETEKILKSILTYEYAKEYQENYAFLKSKNYDRKKQSQAFNIISDFSNIISFHSNTKKNKGKNAIKHYINNYSNIPIWVLTNFLTLGQVTYFYNTLTPKFKYKVVRNHINPNLTNVTGKKIKIETEIFEAILQNIRQLRNVVAHNNRLVYFKCKNNIKYIDGLHDTDKRASRQSVYSVIVSLKCFLDKHRYKQFHNILCKIVDNFKGNIENVEYAEKVLNSLGIPSNIKELK